MLTLSCLPLVALCLCAGPASGATPAGGLDAEALRRTAALEAEHLKETPDDTQSLYRLGLAYLSLNEPKRALQPLRALAKKDPESLDAKILLARALRLSGEAPEARKLLDAALVDAPDDASLHAERGMLARLLEETDIAITQYGRAVELSPSDPELRFNLGEALQKRGKTDEAIAVYREVLKQSPELSAAKVNLAKALVDKGQYNEAKDLLASATKNTLADAEAHYNLGVILMREGNVSGAMGEYQRALAANPEHALAHNNLGVALDAINQNKKAAEEFKKAIKAEPGYAEAYFNLGLSYYRAGDGLRATKSFEKALALEPRSSGPYTKLGELYLAQGKKDRAVEAFKKAVEATQDDRFRNVEAYRGLALAYLSQGKPKEAVDTLKVAVAKLPDDISAHAALAGALSASGDLDGAIAEYEKRLKLEPTAEAKLDLARAYAKKRVGAKAEPLFKEVVKEAPDNAAARMGLVDLYLAMGNYLAAEDTLKAAIAANPNDMSAKARLGIVDSRKQKPDQALPLLEEVAQKDPTQLDARAELGFLYERGGDVDKGIQVLGEVLTIEPRHPLALLYLGHALYRKGHPQQAEESFLAAAKVDPTFAEPHFQLGQLYEAQKKLPLAKKEYETAASLENHPDAKAAAQRLAKEIQP